MIAPEKLPPNNIEAESALLGGLLIDPQAIVRVAAILEPGDFYQEVHGWFFEAALALMKRGEPIDFLTICNELDAKGRLDELGGPSYVTGLILDVPSSIHVEHYARIIEKAATRRRLIDAAAKMTAAAYREDSDVDELWSRSVKDVVGTRRPGGNGPASFKEVASRSYDRLESVARRDGSPGILTGFKDLDELLHGLQPKDLIVLAARPSVGKTSLALNIATNAAKAGLRPAVFSLEMSEDAIATRIESQESGIPFSEIRDGKIGSQWDLFMRAIDKISGWDGWIDDTPGITPSYLRAETMRLMALYGVDLVVVDYLQLMRGDGRQLDARQRFTEIVQEVKAIAKDLGIPFILLSQLSRATEQRQDKRPILSDLLETGAIEAAADVVIFLYREEMYEEDTERHNIADAIVAKHRNGPTGTVSLYFDKEKTRFMNAEIRYMNVEIL